MPPLGGKGKSKGREGRQSRSRNTTPSSIVSLSASIGPSTTAYLDIPIGHLMVPTNINYDDILERHGGGGGIPDPKHLETMANDLKTLSQLAETRGQACDGGMRELAKRRKEKVEEEREREQATREAGEKESIKRAAEDDDDTKGRKKNKVKKPVRERITAAEERPLTHGAHGLARQDGLDLPIKEEVIESRRPKKKGPSPPIQKQDVVSGSSSSLSPASQLQSPATETKPQDIESARTSSSPSSESLDSHQPPPAASIAQYQTFGPDPLTFDDPTVYHIRKVRDDMTDEEKKEIYCVASFPHDDLSNLIAGTPPDKDFSNAKPTNQVNSNTFSAYLEPYLRPLTEEDMAFLKERGDRVTPFVIPRRGKRHYTEIWAEEDGSISLDPLHQTRDKLPQNQPRGALEQIDDEAAETDQVSNGPLMSRLLSTMRTEHRPPPGEDKEKPNGLPNGTSEISLNGHSNGIDHLIPASPPSNDNPSFMAPATFMPESAHQSWKTPTPKLDAAQADDRLKAELRYIGFLGPESEPDYDAHYDDDVAARLRTLQAELKEQSIVNGARKARILELANERMAHQEYSTILEDLDSQVQQAYLKRTRTLGKGKKNVKRPGGAGGGSHYVGGAAGGAGGGGVTKPGIGDAARQMMERRKKWDDQIGPLFGEEVTRVRGAGEGIFGEDVMERLVKAERERWDEEAE
ncbi:Transcriptional regulator [Toensbergia leucococca]|nr:Transcriptional regulator [Toensbergia leucococca]